MPRTRNPFPPLCRHKATGQWYYAIAGKRRYLGTDKAEAERRRITELSGNSGRLAGQPSGNPGELELLTAEAVALYLAGPAKQLEPRGRVRMDYALTTLSDLYGHLPASGIRVSEVEAVAAVFLKAKNRRRKDKTISRNYVGKLLSSIRQAWRWLAMRDKVSAESAHKVGMAVAEFRRDLVQQQPVTPEVFAATLRHLPQQHADAARVQLATGMRTGELLGLSWAEIDQSGKVWAYRPSRHKNAHRGKGRTVYLGKTVQEILRRYAFARDGRIFRSSLAVYAQAIRRACAKAGMAPWNPYRLRHTAATAIRAEHGDDAAIRLLGHAGNGLLATYASGAAEIQERRRAG